MSVEGNLDIWIEKASQIRAFERLILDEFGKGNIRGTFHTSYGQELTSVILASFLKESDFVFGTHRSHALFLALSGDFKGLAAEVLGRVGASSSGIGGSQHLNHRNFFSNGIQGGMCSLAVGAAYSDKGLSVVILGDGTLGEGAVYESLNLASVLGSNTLFLLEDNGIAQSTISEYQRAGAVSKRFEAFDIPFAVADSNDMQELSTEISKAIDHVRRGIGPFALHIKSSRLGAHSKGDDNRSQDLVNALMENDLLSNLLSSSSSTRDMHLIHLEDFGKVVLEVLSFSNAVEVCQNYAANLIYGELEFLSCSVSESKKIRDIVYEALKETLSFDHHVMMIGEDIEYMSCGTSRPYGGAFGVTQDLSEIFPKQVVNSPISESAITGFAIGRALSGRPTIVEIMFGDFTTLTVDAMTQQASKIVSMYGKQISLPMLMRTPSGGRRGYGPTHSQNFESFFLGIPNLIIYSQNIFSSSKHYLELIKTNLPVIVFENKDLYTLEHFNVPLKYFDIRFTKNNNLLLESKFGKSKICILTYGFAVNLTLKAAEALIQEFEIFTNLVVPQVISPLNLDFASDTLRSSDVIYLVEECDGASGLSGLLIKELQRLNISLEVKLISGEGIIGASGASESKALISVEKIISALAPSD